MEAMAHHGPFSWMTSSSHGDEIHGKLEAKTWMIFDLSLLAAGDARCSSPVSARFFAMFSQIDL
jgi:hypothetical protein